MAAYATGEFCWYELGTREIDAAVKFYNELAHWQTITHEMGEQGVYYIFQLEGQDVGGGYRMSGPQFEGVPPHWMPYVWVDDVNAAVAKAGQLGGKVIAPSWMFRGWGGWRSCRIRKVHTSPFSREESTRERLVWRRGRAPFPGPNLMTTNAANRASSMQGFSAGHFPKCRWAKALLTPYFS